MFKPTFLYIKRHSSTGLLYFGKTVKRNVEKYNGSGKYWVRHLRKHGTVVETLWFCLFYDEDSCREFATNFSKINNIVDSEQWANLMIENGVTGAQPGHPSFITEPEVVSRKISEKSTLNWSDPEFRERVIESQKIAWTDDRKQAMAEIMRQKWTDPDYKQNHINKLSGKKTGPNKLRGVPKTKEHNLKNSASLRGILKSEEHKKNLSEAVKIRKVCRLYDRRVMSVTHFTRWLKSVVNLEPFVAHSLE